MEMSKKVVAAQNIFHTTSGRDLQLIPISPYTLDDIRGSVTMPDQPNYIIDTAVVYEEHPLTEDTIEVPDNPEQTEKNRAIWNTYKVAYAAAERELSNKLLEVIVCESVVLPDGEPSDAWIRRRLKLIGNVPGVSKDADGKSGSYIVNDPDQLKMTYILRELVCAPSEITALVKEVLRVSEIDEGVLAAADASFRSEMERRQNTQRDTSAAGNDGQGVMATQPSLFDGAHGEGVASNS